jgi:RNA polymerase sigma factor (sigma-70 family)
VSITPFEHLVTRHGATVLRVCRAVVGPHDAQDAWSETFLAALRTYPDLDDGANIQAWLVTIAHRKALDIIRARARDPIPMHNPPDGPAPPADSGHLDEIWATVAALPTKQRQAVAYHYLGGLPFRQVAEILGGSTDAARRAAADGIASLRLRATELDPHHDPNGLRS